MESVLKQRIVTGALLLLIVFFGVLFLSPSWFAVATMIVFLATGGWEWGRLVGFEAQWRGVFAGCLIAVGLLVYLSAGLQWAVMIAGFVWWCAVLVLLVMYQQGDTLYRDNRWLLRAPAFLVLIPAWIALVTLHQQYPPIVLYLIFLVASADSGAYFAGRAFGKHKLAPALSPGKTREGVMGGVAGVGIISLIGGWALGLEGLDWIYFISLSLLTGLISVAGDLFESLIKREARMKDSGSILPGHGGILDRIDGLLAALPLFTLGLFWGGIEFSL